MFFWVFFGPQPNLALESTPPCNHVGVQLRSEGGGAIGDDSAAKNLKNPKGGPKGPPGGGGPVGPPVGFFRFLDAGTIKSSACAMSKIAF